MCAIFGGRRRRRHHFRSIDTDKQQQQQQQQAVDCDASRLHTLCASISLTRSLSRAVSPAAQRKPPAALSRTHTHTRRNITQARKVLHTKVLCSRSLAHSLLVLQSGTACAPPHILKGFLCASVCVCVCVCVCWHFALLCLLCALPNFFVAAGQLFLLLLLLLSCSFKQTRPSHTHTQTLMSVCSFHYTCHAVDCDADRAGCLVCMQDSAD